jgi:cytochrome c oxidase assembly protein subunit 15
MELRFRQLAVGTAALTGILLVLGVYTAAVGAGLTCGRRWPLCDGFLGLFPANWPSCWEWFHRLVAMVVGFMILGAGVVAWRGDYDRYVRFALTLAIVMLPVQIIFGANTVLNFGLWASMAHQIAAQIIFGSLVFATTVAFWSAKSRPETQPSRSPTPSNADD